MLDFVTRIYVKAVPITCQTKDSKIINIYTPNNRASQYMKEKEKRTSSKNG